MCEETFTCQQSLEEHKELYHELNALLFKCKHVSNNALKRKSIKSHIRIFHQTPFIERKECVKKSLTTYAYLMNKK